MVNELLKAFFFLSFFCKLGCVKYFTCLYLNCSKWQSQLEELGRSSEKEQLLTILKQSKPQTSQRFKKTLFQIYLQCVLYQMFIYPVFSPKVCLSWSAPLHAQQLTLMSICDLVRPVKKLSNCSKAHRCYFCNYSFLSSRCFFFFFPSSFRPVELSITAVFNFLHIFHEAPLTP